MPDTPHRSFWQRLRRLMLVAAIIFIALIVSCIVYLQTRPVPSHQDIMAGEQEYRRIRAMFPEPARRLESGTTHTLAASTFETPQARCDRLVQELLVPEKYWTADERWIGTLDSRKVLSVLGPVEAIAAFYDQGIRVSPELSGRYTTSDIKTLECIASILISGMKAEDSDTSVQIKLMRNESPPAKNLNNIIHTLKFMRVTDAVVHQNELLSFYQYLTSGITNCATPLPNELSGFDTKLLAPPGPMDASRAIKSTLDRARWTIVERENVLKFDNAFRLVKTALQSNSNTFFKNPVVSNAFALGVAWIVPPTAGANIIKEHIQEEKIIQAYAVDVASGNFHPENIPPETFAAIEQDCEQIQSRRFAGVLELRRGAAIPKPDEIGPESYFYDPLTQRPYQMYQLPESNGTVQVVMCRTVAPYVQKHEKNRPLNLKQANVMTFSLPANHPGLDTIPKAPQEIQLSLIYK